MSKFESVSINQESSDKQRISNPDLVASLANIRRRSADLKRFSLLLSEEENQDESNQYIKSEIRRESEGIADLSVEEAKKELEDKLEEYIDKIELFKDADPGYVAYLLGQVSKLKQLADQPFQDELQEAISLSEKKNPEDIQLSDLLSNAIILGIEKRQIGKESAPSVEVLAELAIEDYSRIRDIALVLKEEERQRFFALIPENVRREASIVMDKELSRALSQEIIESDDDKEQAKEVHKRVVEYLQSSDEDTPHLIKAMSTTLRSLGTTEALEILKEASKQSIEKTGDNFSRTARIVRTLAETDMFSGKGLIMEFLGNKDLPERYFDYFVNYLHDKGALTKSLDLTKKWSNENHQKLFEYLVENDENWNDRANVTENFENGVSLFGYRNMFSYAGRQDVTPHDALFQFKKIIDLQEKSGLSPEQFFGQILHEVKNDGSTYESGLSYNEFNKIVENLNYSDSKLEEMQKVAGQYPSIEKLGKLNEYFSDPTKIFSSWASLRKFSELSYLLDQAETLEQLENLKKEAQNDPKKEKLYDFIEQIAFSKTGKVDMKAVLEFWQDSESFLERGDAHAPKQLHDAIKPSNYTEVSYLDLSAEDLRDALVDGSLDRVQTFRYMEIIYSVSENNDLSIELDFYDELKKQIGSRKEGNQNRKLFHAVKRILKKHNIDLLKYILDKREVVDDLPPVERQAIEEEVRAAITEFPNQKIQKKTNNKRSGRYRARMNYKGDPQAVLAGNDTSCCMSFGTGKNNCYMWNPSAGLFTVEEQRGNTWRTIAQSVMTIDVDTKTPIPQIIGEGNRDLSKIIDKLPEDVLDQDKKILSCDNNEVSPNSASKRDLIQEIYRNFFEEYIPYFNETADVTADMGKVIVGKSNSDLSFGTQEKNTYLPVSLIGYSDKLGDQVDVISLSKTEGKGNLSFKKERQDVDRGQTVSGDKDKKGIKSLSGEDVLSVTYLERTAYPDSMQEGFIAMQNRIFASLIESEFKKRKNLSLKYVDNKNRMTGYLLAHEGERGGESVIYIEDLAVKQGSRLAGGNLIKAFCEKYRELYLEEGDLKPIFLQAREETSYKILKKQLDKISKQMGVEFDFEEEDNYSYGDSTMYAITLRPRKV